jgi:hypothetical protein
MFTPGPWSVDVGADDRPYVIAHGLTIAKAYRSSIHPERSLAALPGMENATLIAAAPELYQALKWFIDDIDGTRTVMIEFDENVEAARAALAKARGETVQ